MRTRDTFDAGLSLLALAADAVAVFLGFLVAVWIRFDSGLIPLAGEGMPPRMMYVYGAGVATLLCLFIFRSLGLYVRPQAGRYEDKIPRLVRATGWAVLLATALAFIIRTDPPFSRTVTVLAFFTATFLVVLERYLLFRLELHWARHREEVNQVLIVGTDAVAARLKEALKLEPRLRYRVAGFLRTSDAAPDPAIPADQILGGVGDLEKFVERGEVDVLILADTSLSHRRMAELILCCERGMVHFQLVPDLFAVLTSRVQVEHIGEVPLLSVRQWPLDYFWNRVLKRAEDLAGAVVGLVLSAPILAAAAVLIKRCSPGPVFFRQERCGEGGRVFTLYKLRTMPVNAEAATGPVWAAENDPRRTPVGAFLRRYNLDELPQFWNVLKGEMSLAGPRPERPFFVEQFKEDIGRYMWRHSYKPGMTGWAQVNGLRGNTSISERIQYDLFYLENWSLALDFKILLKTLVARQNAY